jgi:hypothetical protein
VEVVTEPGAVVDGLVDGPEGWKVATNGVFDGVGSTTGTPSRDRAPVADPSSTVIVPVAGITWEAPACMVPVHNVEPVEVEVAWTQHGPEAFTVTR